LEQDMLSVHHLVKSLGNRRVIEDVTLSVDAGEIVGLIGPNGAGKTTTFRMLTGLVVPDSGRIELDGTDIARLPFYERARRGISYLPQESFVPRALSVEDNILMVLEAREPSARKRAATVQRLLEQFHIADLRKARVGMLSGGQRRRAEIAVTLACEPRLALLDEPFARVDPHAVEEITGLIRQLAGRGIGILITDHAARELLKMVDRAYVIESGRVLAHGTADVLIADRDVRQAYLGAEFKI
jgi:lipopolysaccharide export system ATP-binding protein